MTVGGREYCNHGVLLGEGGGDMSTIAPAAAVDVDPCKLPQMMAAVKVLLRGLGEDVTRDGLLKTPLRVAQAFQAAIQGIFNLSHSLPRAADRAFFFLAGFLGD